MTKKRISQIKLLKEFFVNNANRDIAHPEVVDFGQQMNIKRERERFSETQTEESGHWLKRDF